MHKKLFGSFSCIEVCIYQRINKFQTVFLYIDRQEVPKNIEYLIHFINRNNCLNIFRNIIIKIYTIMLSLDIIFQPLAMPISIVVLRKIILKCSYVKFAGNLFFLIHCKVGCKYSASIYLYSAKNRLFFESIVLKINIY